jgi:hypothetical protein
MEVQQTLPENRRIVIKTTVMKIFKNGFTNWQNRHETFVEPIKDMYLLGNETNVSNLDAYCDTTSGIQSIIKEALDKNLTLRALGSGWSWTKIATADNGIMLDTKQLNLLFPIAANSVSTSYQGEPAKLFFAQCGNGVWEISSFLQSKNLSLKTSGASNGQTIAGVIATSAHGSSIDVGAVQDFVVGLHIIVSPTRHVYLERKSAPVVSDAFASKIQAELVRDDALFNAALVSFGSFGIVHGVMIETTDLFLLEAHMQRMPYNNSLKGIMETLDFSNANLPNGNERPFHFSSYLNPYDIDGGAFVTTMYKRTYRKNYTPPRTNPGGIGPGDDAPCFIGKLTDVIPALVPTLVNKILGANLVPYSGEVGTLREIFSNTTLHGKLMSAAIGIPVGEVNKVAALLLDLNKSKGPFSGLFAFRYIKKTPATLGFQRFPFTSICELDGTFSNKTLEFYHAAWEMLEKEKIPFTFHWGKMNELSPARIANMYGNDANAWMSARNKLLKPDGMKVFTNSILKQWGLDKVFV